MGGVQGSRWVHWNRPRQVRAIALPERIATDRRTVRRFSFAQNTSFRVGASALTPYASFGIQAQSRWM